MKLFSSKPKVSPKEAAKNAKKETRKEVRSAQRDLDRELRELDRTEKQVIVEIKNRARKSNINPATDTALKSLAKQLVQIRQQKSKMIDAKANLGAVGMHAANMATQVAAASAVGKVSAAMGAANEAVDPREMAKIMNEFSRQNEVMNVREEMMTDALTDAFDNEDLEDEAENITSQVLAELGVELGSQMANAPSKRPVGQIAATSEEVDALPDLKARLDAL